MCKQERKKIFFSTKQENYIINIKRNICFSKNENIFLNNNYIIIRIGNLILFEFQAAFTDIYKDDSTNPSFQLSSVISGSDTDIKITGSFYTID